jgi:hypothetical protein
MQHMGREEIKIAAQGRWGRQIVEELEGAKYTQDKPSAVKYGFSYIIQN